MEQPRGAISLDCSGPPLLAGALELGEQGWGWGMGGGGWIADGLGTGLVGTLHQTELI